MSEVYRCACKIEVIRLDNGIVVETDLDSNPGDVEHECYATVDGDID